MKRLGFVLLACLLMAGCTTAAGQMQNLSSGVLPSYSCGGKSVITGSVGGVGAANLTVTVDCGPGAYLQQLQPGQSGAPLPTQLPATPVK